MSDKWMPISEAMKAMAGRCDGAATRDNVGFAGCDTRWGKYLAALPTLTDYQARSAWKVLARYRNTQLPALGIDYEALPVPPDTNGRVVDANASGWTVRYPKKDIDALLLRIKAFPKRRYWPAPLQYWQVDPVKANAEVLFQFAVECDFEITEAAAALYDKVMSATAAEEKAVAALQADSEGRRIEVGTNRKGEACFLLYFPFDNDIRVKLNSIPSSYFWSERAGRPWSVLRRYEAEVMAIADEFNFAMPSDLRGVLEKRQAERDEQKALAERQAAALQAAISDVPHTRFGDKKVRDYQFAGVQWMTSRIINQHHGCILADDMGAGKTFQAMLTARAFQRAFRARVLIIAPVSLHDVWRDEMEACQTKCEIFSWARIPLVPPPAPFVLMCDEAHYAQNATSDRSQAMMALAASPNCLFVMHISGTPMRGGRPKHIFPLLRSIKHPIANDKSKFERMYCNGRQVTIHRKGKAPITTWDITGESNIDTLIAQIKPIYLRRMKRDIAPELPEKTRFVRKVELSETANAAYNRAFAEARTRYLKRLATGAVSDGGEELVILNHLRLAGSIAKVESAIDRADEVLEQGRQVVLFTEFLESAEAITAHYRAQGIQTELLTGAAKERGEMVKRFQSGESKVWVATIKAGGLGLTLTAASDVILVDRPWMVDDADQAEDRCHRIGQHSPVTAVWLQANETDKQLDARLYEQRRSIAKGIGQPQSPHQIAREIAAALFAQPTPTRRATR